VRKSRIFYMRNLQGKAARITERKVRAPQAEESAPSGSEAKAE